ncbi:MAG: 16S rRNA (cytosine(1402)-N(4))-methyltransferase [Clostridium sp.]|nr:MAG: 16S rRNA (cytosine(1402)-N(4))-methyltransferase [Clostridium sp.]
MKHKSVLLDEVINYLNIHEDGTYVDATLGYAGHSGEVLKRLNEKGVSFSPFDQDAEAIEYSKRKKLSKK